jgi:serine/threonine protein kinase
MLLLESRNMLPSPIEEMNWSGRGQHAEFEKDEEPTIPLKLEKLIGSSATAIVESVLCRRIRLARKSIQCNRRLKREEVIKEVELLQKLSHSHIVQAVGTYVMEKRLSILLYPATEYNLETFMEPNGDVGFHYQYPCLERFFGCLAHSLEFLHSKTIKHMDIKPKNLLVKDMRQNSSEYDLSYKIYIADFGISRSYPSILDSETDSMTSFTKKYAAPEVVAQEMRGLSADVFSLGCVFLEMAATVRGRTIELEQALLKNENRDGSYQANIESSKMFAEQLGIGRLPPRATWACRFIKKMLDADPSKRPSASNIAESVTPGQCCNRGADLFEAAV